MDEWVKKQGASVCLRCGPHWNFELFLVDHSFLLLGERFTGMICLIDLLYLNVFESLKNTTLWLSIIA
jgi:hypothetical protein